MVKDKKMEKLPEGWKIVKLGEIIEEKIRNGFTYNYYQITKEGIPVTRIETISDGHINISKVGYISEILAKKIMKFRLQRGDILLSHINSFEHVGKAAIYKGIPQLLIHGMNLLLIRLSKDKCEPFYFINFLKQDKTRNEIRALSGQAVNQVSIKPNYLANLLIPLPPLPEQRKIAEILETVDNSIEKTDKIIEKYKRIKQGLMQVLLTRGIVESDELGAMSYELKNEKSDELRVRSYESEHKDDELGIKSYELEGKRWEIRDEKKHRFKDSPLGKIPEEWEVVRLGDVATITMGQSPDSSLINKDSSGIPFLQGNAEFTEKYPDPNIWIEKALKLSSVGSILISVRAPVGDLNISDRVYCIGRGLAAINVSDAVVEYVWYVLHWSKDKLVNKGQGSTFEAIGREAIMRFEISLPPLPEQQRIASILSQIDEVIEKEQKYKEKLERIKQGLMEDLLTGKVRVEVD